MRRKNYKLCLCVGVFLYGLYYFFGVSDYAYSKNFEKNFDYPLNTDIRPIVKEVMAGKKPRVEPINYYPYRYLTNSGKCDTFVKINLFLAVKSAMNNFEHRLAIRKTYGQEISEPNKVTKVLFFLGIDGHKKSDTQRKIDKEMIKYKDIIQMDFHDSYYNNTIKTMMTFRWVYEHCPSADYYLFTDDDMYISVNNLLNYVYALRSSTVMPVNNDYNEIDISKNNTFVSNLFAGFVFESAPHRIRSSKWRVSLDEYPWNRWPAYVTAGAYVVSNKIMKLFYVGSLFVKHFRFDDIYLGIVAKKMGVSPTHCNQFYFYKKKYTKETYSNVIASHGYEDHSELIRVWNEQNPSLVHINEE